MLCEFPRTNDGYMTVGYRHGWAVGTSGDTFTSFDELIHYDTETGARKTWALGAGHMGGEAVFAPRVGATEEADGYLLMLAYDTPQNLSELLVFRALEVGKRPHRKSQAALAHPGWLPRQFCGSIAANNRGRFRHLGEAHGGRRIFPNEVMN